MVVKMFKGVCEACCMVGDGSINQAGSVDYQSNFLKIEKDDLNEMVMMIKDYQRNF